MTRFDRMAESSNPWERMTAGAPFPRLYAILDALTVERRGLDLFEVARIWRDTGVPIVQYRDKISSSLDIVSNAARLREIYQGSDTLLVLNDSPAMAYDAGFRAVHIGQGDGSVDAARRTIEIVGVSTHTERQVIAADKSQCFYVAIGPVFATGSKLDAAMKVGVEGVSRARELTRKPLVAIGGISLTTAPKILEAGADSVAIISSLLEGDPQSRARDFLKAVA